MPKQLEIKGVSVAYGDNTIVQGVDLHLEGGDIGCLLGPSGCGKTTLLRAVAGFEPVATGEIWLQGRLVARPGFGLPPEERRAGMVFQDFALFPHLSVARNIAFGLRHQDRRERQARVAELLELIGLPGSGKNIPINCPAASSSASPWPAPWRPARISCSWTNPSPAWTWRCASNSLGRCGSCSSATG